MATATIAETFATYLENPFHGPSPLREGDPIFGRDREIKLLRDQLLSDRLVLLHAISGCGKTSLVEAGLRPLLRKRFKQFPTIHLARTREERPLAITLLEKIARAIAPDLELGQANQSDSFDPVSRLSGVLSRNRGNGPAAGADDPTAELCFLFFDQFETVLADKSISDAERASFFKSLGLLLEAGNVWALTAIREDYLGDLQPFLRYLPTQLRSRFRLTRLSVADAASAIQMRQKVSGVPDGCWSIAFTQAAADSLADELSRGEGFAESSVVEPVHLQVVCDYLWQTYPHPVSVEHLGADEKRQISVTTALGEYYERIVKSLGGGDEDLEFTIRNWFENSLIDSGEHRNKVRIARDSKEITTKQLDFLIDKYLIRDDQPSAPSADRVVELAHDRLIVPILQQNKEWFRRYKQTWLETAAEYSRNPADILLLCGEELQKAWEWSQKNQGKLQLFHLNFLHASLAREQRRRRLRRVTWWATISTLALLVVLPTSFHFARKASIESRDAEKQSHRAAIDKADAERVMEEANNSVMEATNKLDILRPQLLKQQKELKDIKERSRIDHEKSIAEINKANADKLEAQTVMAGAVKYANDTNKALADSNNELARQADAATRLRHQNDAIQAVTSAHEKRDLNGVVLAFKEAQLAGDLALSRVNNSNNVVQRATNTAEDLLGHLFLQNTLCIRGYFQSFAHFPDKNMNLALDQAGYYYNDTITSECPASLPSREQQLSRFPNSSAISASGAAGPYMAAVGTREGDIKVFADGKPRSYPIDMHEPIVALSLSGNGAYLGASSALWSVSLWRLNQDKATRVLRWPGSAWNPTSWLKWIKIFRSTTNQLTDTLAIHVDDASNSAGRIGIMAGGQDDGRVKIVPVNAEAHHSTKPLALLDGQPDNAIVSLRFSQDGHLLATGTRSGIVRIWNLSTDSGVWQGKNQNESVVIAKWNENQDDGGADNWCGGRVSSLEFLSNESPMLAVGCQDGSVHIYDIGELDFSSNAQQRFEQLGRFTASGDIRILVFDPATRVLYSTGPSPYVWQWRIPTRAEFNSYNLLRMQLKDLKSKAGSATQMISLEGEINAVVTELCSSSIHRLTACGPM